jgi:hypothetical protein
MLDDTLNKPAFVDKYKKMGYTDVQIEREWKKFTGDFVTACVKKYMEALPDNDEKVLEDELKSSKNEEEAHKFFDDLMAYFDKHPGLLDEKGTMIAVANEIKKKYNIL